MAKRQIDKSIIEIVQAFILEVKKYYNVDYVILFGSFANGNQHDDSDIDVAVVSKEIQNSFNDSVKMMEICENIDLRIEPHAIRTDDYQKNATALINEIIKTGVQIFAA